MNDDGSARIELAWHRIAQAFVAFRPASPSAEADTLSMSQWRLLTLLQQFGALRAGDLSQRLGMLVPATSRLLRDLELRKYVSRRRDPDDGRATLVTITAAGSRTLKSFQHTRRSALRDLLEQLAPDERSQLVHHFEQIAQLVQDAADQGAPVAHRAPRS